MSKEIDEALWKAFAFPPSRTIASGGGRSIAEYYFNAGVAAERERCLAAVEEIARLRPKAAGDEACSLVAASIRGDEGGEDLE